MLRALLVDLDGVIRLWRSQEDPAAEAAFGLLPGSVRHVAFAPERLQPVITGQTRDEVWRSQIRDQLALEFPEADAAGAVAWWSSPYGEVDSTVLEMIGACRSRATVVLITNATSRLPDDLRRLGLDGAFDHGVLHSPSDQPERLYASHTMYRVTHSTNDLLTLRPALTEQGQTG